MLQYFIESNIASRDEVGIPHSGAHFLANKPQRDSLNLDFYFNKPDILRLVFKTLILLCTSKHWFSSRFSNRSNRRVLLDAFQLTSSTWSEACEN